MNKADSFDLRQLADSDGSGFITPQERVEIEEFVRSEYQDSGSRSTLDGVAPSQWRALEAKMPALEGTAHSNEPITILARMKLVFPEPRDGGSFELRLLTHQDDEGRLWKVRAPPGYTFGSHRGTTDSHADGLWFTARLTGASNAGVVVAAKQPEGGPPETSQADTLDDEERSESSELPNVSEGSDQQDMQNVALGTFVTCSSLLLALVIGRRR